MDWLTWSVIGAFLFSVNSLLGRVLAVRSENPRAFAVVYNTFGAIFALLLWWVTQEGLKSLPPIAYFLLILAILLYGIFNRYEFYARKYVESSTFTILTKFIPIITFTLSILFLGESFTLGKVLAAILIIAGNILVVWRKDKKLEWNQGLKYAAIVIISLGIAWTVDKRASSYLPLALYAFLTYLPPNIFLIFFPRLSWNDVSKEFKLASWKVLVLAFVNVLAYYSLISAFRFGEASRVVLVTSSSTIITVILGIFLLKEHERMARKLTAAIIVTLGALLLR